MQITKEKNWLIITTEANKTYQLDYIKMECIGLRGHPLKKIPPIVISTLKNFCDTNYVHLSLAISELDCYHDDNRILLVTGAELADSFQYPYKMSSTEYIRIGREPELFKKFMKKNINLRWQEYWDLIHSIFAKNHPDITEKTPLLALTLARIIGFATDHKDFFKFVVDKIGKYNLTTSQQEKLVKFYKEVWDLCTRNEVPIDKNNNIIRQFLEIASSENEAKNSSNKNEAWGKIYTPLKDFLFFEDEEFTIQFPEKPIDLIKEGMLMHHCVGGYVDSVLEQRCIIVFVRKKENPNAPYITCELYKSGQNWNIGQYYLAYDRSISNIKDATFKNKYLQHLKNIK